MGYEFQQVSGQKTYRPWKHWQEGDTFIGKFVSTSEDDYGKTNYEFKTLEVEFEEKLVKTKNQKKEAIEYAQPEEGDLFVMNSCGSLEKAMEKCDFGDIVKVVYTGTTTLTKGKYAGKEAHTVEVFRQPGVAKSGPAKSASVSDVDLEDAI